MATMITNDCINCGACEPECPNNAISQGETIFVIDPQLCTECVGFHDYEACAAVCPVDCCVTDPNNIEPEEALIARARVLHPDTPFGENFESRFRKGQGKGATEAPKKDAPAKPAPAVAASTPSTSVEPAAAATAGYLEPEVNFVILPAIDSWKISLRCFKCNETKGNLPRKEARNLPNLRNAAPGERKHSRPTNRGSWQRSVSSSTGLARTTMLQANPSKKGLASVGDDRLRSCSIPGCTSSL